ncbi:hypothetical protein ILUMI_08323 [Ignelater luminosus]|uniref:Uncharacterized protein n=1 Tax=Ignelater luminosus TaxID=2038154 RepID=A0A8K0GDI4_IGNLU|nr:hypothetical protein ILUMI_08323 [Ignelater luminosus]
MCVMYHSEVRRPPSTLKSAVRAVNYIPPPHTITKPPPYNVVSRMLQAEYLSFGLLYTLGRPSELTRQNFDHLINPRISPLTVFNIWNKNIKNTKSDAIFAYFLQELGDLTLPNDVLKDIKKPKSLSSDRALAIMVDANLSACQYNVIRQEVKDINPKLYPAYQVVKEAKKARYPRGITVTEVGAKTELQSLVDHTIRRLCVVQEDVLRTLTLLQERLSAIIKWGCDGAG